MKYLLLLMLATVLVFCGCDDDGDGGDAGMSDTDSTSDPECDGDGPDNGCLAGFYCDVNNTCQQDCTTNQQCELLHGEYWECNEYGQCIFVGQ